MRLKTHLAASVGMAALIMATAVHAAAPIRTSTGATITPLAAPGATLQKLAAPLPDYPNFVADHPQTSAVSPDGTTMLVLTSGFNGNIGADDNFIPADTGEFIFVYHLAAGQATVRQVLKINNSYSGLVWAPDGSAFYAAGGQDDNVHVFTQAGGVWTESATPIALNHGSDGSNDGPVAAGLGITADGKTLIVANYMHDSVSLIDLPSQTVLGDQDLRPGKNNPAQSGVPGGEFPFWVSVVGNSRAYVSSERDHEIVVLALACGKASVSARIAVGGVPNKMVLNKAQTRLYVAADNADAVYIINTANNRIIDTVTTTTTPGVLAKALPNGANPNSIALSPDETRAYVTDSATNAVAVIDLTLPRPKVIGLIPTGWLPNSVSVSSDGATLFVADGKTPAGPNRHYCSDTWNNSTRDTN